MRLSCPSCGATQSLDNAVAHAAASKALALAFAFPAPIGQHLVRYLGLFRSENRALSFDRVDRLLGELLPMIQAGRVERRGRVWAAPLDAWRQALEQIVDGSARLTLPLKSHGYLLEIVAGISNREEAAVETKREAKRAGATPIAAPVPVPSPTPPLPVVPRAERQAGLKRLKDVLGQAAKEST